jgi:hypothetical protein
VLVDKLGEAADQRSELEMEERFCSVSLDIIGKAVFNYPFDSVTKESPVIKVRRANLCVNLATTPACASAGEGGGWH